MDDKDPQGHEEEVKVHDRRRFTPEGETRSGEDVPAGEPAAGSPPAAPEPPRDAPGAKAQDLPPIDFTTFVLSLATSAQVHLGAIPNPATGKPEPELSLAKQTIDILGILEEKTKGNLSEAEGRLLEHVLFDLRMMYVEQSKA